MRDTGAGGAGAGPTAWVDGRLVAADEPALRVGDRGFQLGDGLFETLRVRRGVVIEIELHLTRLHEGLGILAIPMPLSDGELAAAIAAAVAANAPADVAAANVPSAAAVRITVSRGAPAGRGSCRPGGGSSPRRWSSRPGRTCRLPRRSLPEACAR